MAHACLSPLHVARHQALSLPSPNPISCLPTHLISSAAQRATSPVTCPQATASSPTSPLPSVLLPHFLECSRVFFPHHKTHPTTPLFNPPNGFPLALGIKTQTLTKPLHDEGPTLHLHPCHHSPQLMVLLAPRDLARPAPSDHSVPNSSCGRCPFLPQATSSKATLSALDCVPGAQGLGREEPARSPGTKAKQALTLRLASAAKSGCLLHLGPPVPCWPYSSSSPVFPSPSVSRLEHSAWRVTQAQRLFVE